MWTDLDSLGLRLQSWLSVVGIVLFSPALLLWGVVTMCVATYRIHRAKAGARDLGYFFDARLVDDTITVERFGDEVVARVASIARPSRVTFVHLEGDGGFADANSVTYLVVIVGEDGTRHALTVIDKPAIRRFRQALADRGIAEYGKPIPHAIGSGCALMVLAPPGALWLAIIAWILLR